MSSVTVAVTTVAALGDLTRFEHPRQLMHDLGLTPSEYSSGGRRQQGGMTKTGNTHARRALVEGAWASRYPAKVSRHLPLRLAKLPTAIQAISWKAQVRLCTTVSPAHGHRQTMPIRSSSPLPEHCVPSCGPLPSRLPGHRKHKEGGGLTHKCQGFQPLSEETQPRCGGTLGGVMRPTGTLVPRLRQAPDGCKEGGSQPTDISVINRRVLLAPALPIEQREKT